MCKMTLSCTVLTASFSFREEPLVVCGGIEQTHTCLFKYSYKLQEVIFACVAKQHHFLLAQVKLTCPLSAE